MNPNRSTKDAPAAQTGVPILEHREFVAFSCFDADLFSVEATVDHVLQGDTFTKHWEELKLPEQPYRAPMQGTFWAPRSAQGKTALVAQLEDGWQTLCRLIATKGAVRTLVVRASSRHAEWPVVDFQYYEDSVPKRCVRAMKDDSKWDFFQQGEALAEEDPYRYRARRIRDRLTSEDVSSLATKLGWPVSDEGFWSSTHQALRVTLSRPW